ncbi:MAG: hypothetical protein V9G19_10155 [Tetrasphaera sp.]
MSPRAAPRCHSPRLAVPDGTHRVGDRDELVRLVGALPPRGRAVVVLRYFEEAVAAYERLDIEVVAKRRLRQIAKPLG